MMSCDRMAPNDEEAEAKRQQREQEQQQQQAAKETQEQEQNKQQQEMLVRMREQLESIRGQIRVVKLRQSDANSKLGFSLRGGKELTGSSVGVFVSHVEHCSEAELKGLKIGDQLIQVNGLDVNQATYEEVVGLIREAPKCDNILLRVANMGRIPVQAKSGEPIKWIQVEDLLAHFRAGANEPRDSQQQRERRMPAPRASAKGPAPIPPTLQTTATLKALKAACSANLSSDEGNESCEGHSREGSSSLSSSELLADHCELAVCNSSAYLRGDDSAISSTPTCSTTTTTTTISVAAASSSSSSSSVSHGACDENSSLSACSISISSVQSSSSSVAGDELAAAARFELICSQETIVRVPGGRRTSTVFGCGVVKGPDEWPGIFVQNVRQGSLAEQVGLQLGDQLTRANGRHLDELPFEAAIELIKQLQQQRSELELHVKKGAALEHLASSRSNYRRDNQHEHNYNHHNHNHHHQQQQQAATATTTLAAAAAGCAERSWNSGAVDTAGTGAARLQTVAPQANKVPLTASEASPPVGRSETTKTKTTELRAAPSQAHGAGALIAMPEAIGPSPSAAGCNTAPVWPAAAGGQKTSAQDCSSSSATKAVPAATLSSSLPSLPGAANPISGTQTQLSGKQAERVQGDYNTVDVNMEMRTSWSSSKAEATAAAAASSCLVQRGRSQSAAQATAVNNGEQAPANCEESTRVVCQIGQQRQNQHHQQQQQQQQHHHHHHRQQQQGFARDSSKRTFSSELIETTCRTEEEEEEEDDKENGVAIARTRHCKSRQEQEQEPEIRIVSQNCKLHQTHSMNSFKTNVVHERFPHPAAKLEQQQQQQQQQARRETTGVARKALGPGATSRRRQTVGDMKRQLDAGRTTRSSLLQSHRHISMDNLSLCTTGQQQRRLLRNSAQISRQETLADLYGYSRLPVLEPDYAETARLRPSQRSSSLMSGQQPLCCLQAHAGLLRSFGANEAADSSQAAGSRTLLVKCSAFGQHDCASPAHLIRRTFRDQCCSQQRQVHVGNNGGKRYGSHTLGAPLAAARSKALSMDKLNMNISMNYVRIGSSGCRVTRQQQQPSSNKLAAGAVSSGASKQLRALVGQRHLLMGTGELVCCAARTRGAPSRCLSPTVHSGLEPQQQPVVYKYATASGMIANSTSGASSSRTRMRRSCCSAVQQASPCPSSWQAAVAALSGTRCQQQHMMQQRRVPACCSTTLAPLCATSNSISQPQGDSCSCCSEAVMLRRCSATTANQQSATNVCSLLAADKQQQLTACEMPRVRKQQQCALDGGTSTDSSGYLSAVELRQPRQQLLKMCPNQRAPQPPPPPPTLTEAANKYGSRSTASSAVLASSACQRGTRQRLTTFLASPASGGGGCSGANGALSSSSSAVSSANSRLLGASSDASPSSYSSSSISTSAPGTSDSSLSFANDDCNTTTSASVSPIWHQHQHHQQQHQQQRRRGAVATGAEQPKLRHPNVPCPPPLPALELAGTLGAHLEPAHTFDRRPDARGRKSAELNTSNDIRQQQQQQQLPGEPIGNGANLGKQNRLCFVDELKMLARQQQLQSSAPSSAASFADDGQSAPESAALIKIINATKLAAAQRKGCSCQRTSNRDGNANGKAVCTDQTGNSAGEKCLRSSHKSHEAAAKSGKLDEEDNKRRQHEMLMKEFKSAHSKMFNKRRGNLQTEILSGDATSAAFDDRPTGPNVAAEKQQQQPPNRRTNVTTAAVKTMGTRKISLLAQAPVHVAAAN